MNMRGFMKSMGWLSWMREKLINAGVSPQDLQGVSFDDPESLNKLAEKIVPWLLRANPQMAKKIKESGWLDQKTKEEVVQIVDNI